MTARFIDPGSIQERRAAWLDRGFVRRVKEMALHPLLQFRAQHCQQEHRGADFHDPCWKCHLIKRWLEKRICQPRVRVR